MTSENLNFIPCYINNFFKLCEMIIFLITIFILGNNYNKFLKLDDIFLLKQIGWSYKRRKFTETWLAVTNYHLCFYGNSTCASSALVWLVWKDLFALNEVWTNKKQGVKQHYPYRHKMLSTRLYGLKYHKRYINFSSLILFVICLC